MGNNTTMEHAPLAQALADQLPDGIPDHIRTLFATVPRHRFLPDIMWGPDRVRYDRTTDPGAWMRAAYWDQPLTTQRDDGREGGMGIASSSSSAPTVMARMLTAADLAPAHSVMEVGTGTGFNAALLCELVGGERVCTMEIDQVIADTARSTLHRAGYAPEIFCHDAETITTDAPEVFHRIIATCQVAHIPPGWLTQLRPSGLLITPWSPSPGTPGGALAVLKKRHGKAEGRFEGSLGFMWARGQRWHRGRAPDVGAIPDHTVRAEGDPRDLLDGESGLLLSLLVPGWACGMRMEPGASEPYLWLTSTSAEPGWAQLHPDGRVEQGGGRRLVKEFETALTWWRAQSAPPVDQFGLTVDEDRRHTVWVHEPQHALWTMPEG
ncbi:methyltransferase domain-containing protein [Nocardiopsis sp. NPDC007018]|uniref:protein-L-isoaspartate O-methyltransferase family protein n=1 Tax=Nocardiopsis sp. NPDC007018 TaxID=3155721 RepID=UPI0033C990A1